LQAGRCEIRALKALTRNVKKWERNGGWLLTDSFEVVPQLKEIQNNVSFFFLKILQSFSGVKYLLRLGMTSCSGKNGNNGRLDYSSLAWKRACHTIEIRWVCGSLCTEVSYSYNIDEIDPRKKIWKNCKHSF